MNDVRHFEELVRAARDRSRMAPLLRALGFDDGLRPVRPVALGDADGLGIRTIWQAGERRALQVLLVELAASAEPAASSRIARRARARSRARPRLFIFAEADYRRLTFTSFGLDGELRRLPIDRHDIRTTDVEALAELAARDGERGVRLALRHARALDRSRVTERFFIDLKSCRARIAAEWTGLPADRSDDRDQLALLLLCRLMFLYFLQRDGHLAGDPSYLAGLLARWRRRPGPGTFYRSVIEPLFFGALNTRPERRDAAARALGELPYLNGGLFERHAIERRFDALDLPDAAVSTAFDDLLERYRFTTIEASESAADETGDVGIDPEMLGRVFEGLMAADRRGATGTFFTPAPVVDRLVRGALAVHLTGRTGLGRDAAGELVDRGDASRLSHGQKAALARMLESIRVLDPACGSGAFLLGALARIERLRCALGAAGGRAARGEIVARTLYGLDLQEDAALLCALRLWLALATAGRRSPRGSSNGAGDGAGDAAVQPLPNLDRRVRQGDALVDPLDLPVDFGAVTRRPVSADAGVRRRMREIQPLAERYLSAGPEERPELAERLRSRECELAEEWLTALDRRIQARQRELRGRAESLDLFGDRPADARRAERELEVVRARSAELTNLRRRLADDRALPFFSFAVHFSEAVERGFDIVLSNPPWVRAHRWPGSLRRYARERYRVCRAAGWRGGAELAGAPRGVGAQIDLSLLFLERAMRLLAPGGTLAVLLPSKALRSLYGGGARRLLLGDALVAAVEDHSLDQGSMFRADAFAAAIIARKRGDTDAELGAVRVTLVRRGARPLRFAVERDDLPVLPNDSESPWLLAPPGVRAALRRMQRSGRPIGRQAGLRTRRGVVTGANDVFVMREVDAKLAGLARIRAAGADRRARRQAERPGRAAFEAVLEMDALRPLVRGSGISAWSFRTDGHLLWIHDDRTGESRPPPKHVGRYLERHAERLRRRSGWNPSLRLGAIFRVNADTTRPKVAWHDLAENLNAVALPAEVPGADGVPRSLIPLNTVYYIPTRSTEEAMLLAAYLNSLPLRTFARAIAQRAKDARFRFLAWTIGVLPLPAGWAGGPSAAHLLRIARAAHEAGGIGDSDARELNRAVAAAYGLSDTHLEALGRFDEWLRPGVRT